MCDYVVGLAGSLRTLRALVLRTAHRLAGPHVMSCRAMSRSQLAAGHCALLVGCMMRWEISSLRPRGWEAGTALAAWAGGSTQPLVSPAPPPLTVAPPIVRASSAPYYRNSYIATAEEAAANACRLLCPGRTNPPRTREAAKIDLAKPFLPICCAVLLLLLALWSKVVRTRHVFKPPVADGSSQTHGPRLWPARQCPPLLCLRGAGGQNRKPASFRLSPTTPGQ